MDIIQVVIIGMIGTILTITVKQYKPELAALLALATGILILFFGFSALQSALDRVVCNCKRLQYQHGVYRYGCTHYRNRLYLPVCVGDVPRQRTGRDCV